MVVFERAHFTPAPRPHRVNNARVHHDDSPRRALQLLRRFSQGLLLLDGAYHARRFVLDGADGRPVLPMPKGWDPRRTASFENSGEVFYLPDDSDPELQLIVHPEAVDPRTHEGVDRWTAWHGAADERRWAALRIESARWSGGVCDGDEIQTPNPLRPVETRLLKDLNTDRARLATICERGAGVRPESPLAVGIDPDGLNVRASLGVVRIEFPSECPDEAAARRAIDAMAGDSAR